MCGGKRARKRFNHSREQQNERVKMWKLLVGGRQAHHVKWIVSNYFDFNNSFKYYSSNPAENINNKLSTILNKKIKTRTWHGWKE